MAKRIRTNTNPRQVIRLTRKIRIKKKLDKQKGHVARLVVYRSNKYLYAQVVDDLAGRTLAQANTREKDFQSKSGKNVDTAKTLGTLIGKRALEAKVKKWFSTVMVTTSMAASRRWRKARERQV